MKLTILSNIPLLERIIGTQTVPQVLIGISIMLICGFLFTRITKKLRLPNVTAYLFAGILLGPIFKIFYEPGFISDSLRESMNFLTELSLVFIAFGVGRFLKFEILKQSRKKVLIITLFESMTSLLLMFGLMIIVGKLTGLFEWRFALLLGVLAAVTSPTSTMMTIRQTKAKGDFVNTVLQVVTLDNAISLVLFSISMAIITAGDSNSSTFMVVAIPIIKTVSSIIIGIVLGVIVDRIVNVPSRSTDNRLIITLAILMIFSGIAYLLGVSPLLGCMAMGMTYVNLSKEESLFRQLEYFSPVFLTLFFVLSGMRLNLASLFDIGWLGLVYFVVRLIGKFGGVAIGSQLANASSDTKKYLGLSLIPQAGVALGLAASGAVSLINAGLVQEATMLSTIIIAAGVLYEITGPPSVKLSLYLTKSYEVESTQTVNNK